MDIVNWYASTAARHESKRTAPGEVAQAASHQTIIYFESHIMKKNSTPQKTVTNHRDAGSGQFVTKRYAETHPKTTVTERNKVDPKRK